jgi:predicted outer membrane repeat protein
MLSQLAMKVARGVAAGTAVTTALWTAQAAQALAPVVGVSCSPTVLANAINAAAFGETLNLAAGCTYVLTAGLPTVFQNLTIQGNQATLERSTDPSTQPFTILTAEAGTLTVNNLNFTNGNDAIFAEGTANLTVNGGTFSGNSAADGGAINASTGPGNLTVTGATFIDDTASDSGGAIYTSEAAGSTTITGDKFFENSASNVGGAFYDFNVFGAGISNSVFDGNQAPYGGAIFNNSLTGESLTSVTVRHNTASQDGGGIYSIFAPVSIINSRVTGNQAAQQGGGIYMTALDFGLVGLALTGTVVDSNSAQDGGGIFSDNNVMQIAGGSIHLNHAAGNGAGIYNNGSAEGFDLASINGTSVTFNLAGGDGGGVYNVGVFAASDAWISYNLATIGGGGIFNGAGDDTDTVSLTSTPVLHNAPDNCEPMGSVPGCSMPKMAPGGRAAAPSAVRQVGLSGCRLHSMAGHFCCAERGHGANPGVRACPAHKRAPMVPAGNHNPLAPHHR